jgi:Importin-beta N-terminal domain
VCWVWEWDYFASLALQPPDRQNKTLNSPFPTLTLLTVSEQFHRVQVSKRLQNTQLLSKVQTDTEEMNLQHHLPPNVALPGDAWLSDADTRAHLEQIVKDLQIVHDPLTDNTRRLQSQSVPPPPPHGTQSDSQRLDQVRDSPASWSLALALASQTSSFPDPVKHFGISVLEAGIKYHWGNYSDREITAIRQGLIQLCGEVISRRP